MFTGLIKGLGLVDSVQPHGEGLRLGIRWSSREPLERGESIAVNGVCLTVFPVDAGFYADVSPETLKLTTLGALQSGRRVNLERALALGDRLGGHMVQGHVDTTGELLSIERGEQFSTFRWRFPGEFHDLVVPKGSIAVDGISLTIVDPSDDQFSAAIIPETLEKTTLSTAREGERVNLEFDMMAKYARRMLAAWSRESA